MDELTLLREFEADEPPLSEAAETAALSRLWREMTPAPFARARRSPRPRPRLLPTAAVVASALAVTAALALDAGDFDRPPGWLQPATAAPLLQEAARDARTAPTLRYRDDQFIYVRLTVRERGMPGPKTEATHVNEYWTSADNGEASKVIEHGRTWMEGPFEPGYTWPPRTRDELEALPTKPDELLDEVMRWFNRGSAGRPPATDRVSAMTGLVPLVTRVQAPPDLRAAAFEALARIEGVSVDDDVRVAGRRAIGITVPQPGSPWQEKQVILLDRETSEHLATRTTNRRPQGGEYVQEILVDEVAAVDAIGDLPPDVKPVRRSGLVESTR